MKISTTEFCESLARRSPNIAKILAEHMSDNDNELLPHVFLADVTRHVLADGRDRKSVVKYLNDSFKSSGPEVENLIAVSFVEYLVDTDELDIAIAEVDAPQLLSEWNRQRES